MSSEEDWAAKLAAARALYVGLATEREKGSLLVHNERAETGPLAARRRVRLEAELKDATTRAEADFDLAVGSVEAVPPGQRGTLRLISPYIHTAVFENVGVEWAIECLRHPLFISYSQAEIEVDGAVAYSAARNADYTWSINRKKEGKENV